MIDVALPCQVTQSESHVIRVREKLRGERSRASRRTWGSTSLRQSTPLLPQADLPCKACSVLDFEFGKVHFLMWVHGS
jgi:hypothetical protein